MAMYSIKNRVVLVTGANRGIGKNIVEEFLRNGARKVYAAARNLESLNPLLSVYPESIVPVHIDLNKPETIVAAAEVAQDVEIVVNNAGMFKAAHLLSSDAVAALQTEMEVNVYGLMRMARAFAPILKANGGGALVQLNSIASMKNFSALATYSASKAASYSITQALRDVLKEQGTHVVSVHPGPIATDMSNDAGFGEIAEPAERVSQAIIAALAANEFHSFPDTMAKQIEAAYQGFATNIVEANLMEG
jgi:NAD(P)-dependent dehydrogenase (short-subunit alcohol dehydrogenase family)